MEAFLFSFLVLCSGTAEDFFLDEPLVAFLVDVGVALAAGVTAVSPLSGTSLTPASSPGASKAVVFSGLALSLDSRTPLVLGARTKRPCQFLQTCACVMSKLGVHVALPDGAIPSVAAPEVFSVTVEPAPSPVPCACGVSSETDVIAASVVSAMVRR